VDDEASIRHALRSTLDASGFDVAEAATGEEALALLRDHRYDALLLDMNMPGMGGMKACGEIRRMVPALPILMLTVRDNPEDKVEALDAGADDYVTKPFHVRELIARIRAAIRRAETAPAPSGDFIRVGEIEIIPERREVTKSGSRIRLTPTEFDLLHYLMTHAGKPIAHSHLLSAVWGNEYGGELEYLRTFIHQLRKKLEDDPSHPSYLLTETWFGYRFTDPAALTA
jgi:two-component system KDP operon response regulator KdpE